MIKGLSTELEKDIVSHSHEKESNCWVPIYRYHLSYFSTERWAASRYHTLLDLECEELGHMCSVNLHKCIIISIYAFKFLLKKYFNVPFCRRNGINIRVVSERNVCSWKKGKKKSAGNICENKSKFPGCENQWKKIK